MVGLPLSDCVMLEPEAIVVGWPESGVQTLLPTAQELGAVQLAGAVLVWHCGLPVVCTTPLTQA